MLRQTGLRRISQPIRNRFRVNINEVLFKMRPLLENIEDHLDSDDFPLSTTEYRLIAKTERILLDFREKFVSMEDK